MNEVMNICWKSILCNLTLSSCVMCNYCYFQRILLLSGDIEQNPGPVVNKICPLCKESVHIRKTVCKCGHRFSKKSVEKSNSKCFMTRQESNKIAKAQKKALETPEKTERRHTLDRIAKAHAKSVETEEQTSDRKSHNLASKRKCIALETEEQTSDRRSRNLASKRKCIALETEEQTSDRRSRNLASKRKQLACETEDEALIIRKEGNRESASKRRKLESEEETSCRRQLDRACKARRRLFETDYVRQQKNKENRVLRRQCSTNEKAIAKFWAKIQFGADYVCTSCHRLMYRNSVVTCNRGKYSTDEELLLDSVLGSPYISNDGNVYVCKTCDSSLKCGVLPAQSLANNLKLPEIPPELSKLNALEIRLISLRVPFMKMVALPVGKQKCIHGPAVNIPSKLDTVCTELPHLPSQSELISFKFKRKLSYKGHYMYDYVTPQHILDALRWLQQNNPLYKDINVNTDWVAQALIDDKEILCSMIENPPVTSNDVDSEHSPPPSPLVTNNTGCCDIDSSPLLPTPSPLPPPVLCHNNVNDVSDVLETVAREKGFTVHEVHRDGNCLFSSVAYQSEISSDKSRSMLVSYLSENCTHYSNFCITSSV